MKNNELELLKLKYEEIIKKIDNLKEDEFKDNFYELTLLRDETVRNIKRIILANAELS